MTQELFDKLGQRINQWKINKEKELGYTMSDLEAIERLSLVLKHGKQILKGMN
ncbi:hypothetical protein LCGC14_2646610 [marine sediment metagenome]|uniref:Uncharacterized protein n=1 Tax=marine sediment metagenome TaxID=412755 RepID=A0A0F9CN44_9ZZZZ